MPTYEYQCEACEHAFEIFQSMTEPKKRKCPSCGKNKLERLIGTGGAVLFKGSGFYETDYRSDNYKKRAKADTESKPTGEGANAGNSSGNGAAAKPNGKPQTKAADTASKPSGAATAQTH